MLSEVFLVFNAILLLGSWCNNLTADGSLSFICHLPVIYSGTRTAFTVLSRQATAISEARKPPTPTDLPKSPSCATNHFFR